jgi:serine/threonine protein kinase
MGLDAVKGTMQTVGHYDLLDKIAEGGMGAIYRGRDRRTGQLVAIKIMPPHMAANPVLLKRFEQEFRAASKLDHPNVVRALDYGDEGASPFLVMEFVEGESLGQYIEREGKMPENEAIRIIAQVAQGLHRAHKQNLIHRDVKPDNILIRPDGVAKLADLGLVKEADTDLLNSSGTPRARTFAATFTAWVRHSIRW